MNSTPEVDAHTTELSQYTIPDTFCAKTELENPQPLPKDENYLYPVYEFNVRDLGHQLAFLLAMIESLSIKFGYCFMSNHLFSARLNKSEATIERWLKELTDKKLIYRNTWAKPKGKVRHIIPRSKFIDYWRDFMMRPNISSKVRKKYLNHIFNGEVPDIPIPNSNIHKKDAVSSTKLGHTTLKNEGIHTTLKNEGCLLLRSNSSNKERTTEKADASIAVVDSFENRILSELSSINIQGKRAEMAIEYYRQNKSQVDEKVNPIGWIIQGIQKGWIAEVIQKKKEQISSRIKDHNSQVNISFLIKAQNFLKETLHGYTDDELRITVDDSNVYFFFNKKRSCCPLSIRDPKTLEKVYNCLGNYQALDPFNVYVNNFPESLLNVFNPHEKEKKRKLV